MAGIDTGGGHGGKRATNHEIPLIPFIDFLLCLVAFLLVTAVWSRMARIDADGRAPNTATAVTREKQLHVDMTSERKFQLSWKEGMTVVSTIEVPRKRVSVNQLGDLAYPDLAEKVR